MDSVKDVNVKNDRGLTALHYAAGAGHKEIAEFLISKGADLNVRDNDGSSPLHNATDYKEIVELLIAKGADVNAKNKGDSTVLDYVDTAETEIADLLRKHGAKTAEELKAEGK